MCPLWPLHYLLLYAIMLWPLLMLSCGVAAQLAGVAKNGAGLRARSPLYCEPPAGAGYLNVRFDALLANGTVLDLYDGDGKVPIALDATARLRFKTEDLDPNDVLDGELYLEAVNQHVAGASPKSYEIATMGMDGNSLASSFNVTGLSLGKTDVRLRLRHKSAAVANGVASDRFSDCVPVVVTRPKRVIDTVFTASVATLVAIIFINFGCALDWDVVKKTVKRPIGPAIGFTSQYVVLPLISFGLAKLLFPNDVAMQLGMFFTAISPGGGASNIWTYLLGGNLNLSIAMTTISTLAAFGMMPLWIFTLGHHIFLEGKLSVPYARVMEVAVALVIPVGIGWLIQRYLPRISKFLVRILKPFSTLLILFIIVFAIITNTYIFELFSWQIVLAGMGLPWCGYLTGLLLALVFRQPTPDMMAISVETGVHNTGISIFMLRSALPQPEADLTTVIPVAVAIMTPIPLTLWYVVKQLRSRWTVKKNARYELNDEERAPVTNQTEPLTIITTSKGASNNNHDKY
ncbi:ileal sodium/bile acid cotransporter-like [Thrips palmi]|uniref:Ileal sodium/bile acid cotransporter-like n=1 Tax=Thrips palmi TaxID=161013 RepID=A0A6P9A1K9_THRPL|nr:ileal sodium/bile acid cotransporter-like [Thrips palmi]XP_034251667.1 ileal sodium/bile acid cotransporter-like [Thrips palmi]